jgi:hypothetical protein
VVIVTIVAILIIFVILFAVPFSMPFSISASGYYENVLSVPAGSHVSGTFSANNSDKVGFYILGPGNNPLYQSYSNNGSFSVTAPAADLTFQIYFFGRDCAVEVSGHYTAPILWSPSFPIP